MRYFEVEGDSPAEILEQFLVQQQITEEFVELEVIDPGSKGFMGIGKKPAKVQIKFDDREYLKRKAKLYISEILSKAGFDDCHIETKDQRPDYILNILTDDSSILIGKSALTLDSLQYLVDRALKNSNEADLRVLVDVDNYRERVIAPLGEKAVRLAQSVKRSGQSVKMPPMVTIARREVHIAAKSVQGVSTISHGEGQIKSITIVADKPNKPNKPNTRGFRKHNNNGNKTGSPRYYDKG